MTKNLTLLKQLADDFPDEALAVMAESVPLATGAARGFEGRKGTIRGPSVPKLAAAEAEGAPKEAEAEDQNEKHQGSVAIPEATQATVAGRMTVWNQASAMAQTSVTPQHDAEQDLNRTSEGVKPKKKKARESSPAPVAFRTELAEQQDLESGMEPKKKKKKKVDLPP